MINTLCCHKQRSKYPFRDDFHIKLRKNDENFEKTCVYATIRELFTNRIPAHEPKTRPTYTKGLTRLNHLDIFLREEQVGILPPPVLKMASTHKYRRLLAKLGLTTGELRTRSFPKFYNNFRQFYNDLATYYIVIRLYEYMNFGPYLIKLRYDGKLL